jgi:hypothetical protein
LIVILFVDDAKMSIEAGVLHVRLSTFKAAGRLLCRETEVRSPRVQDKSRFLNQK